MKLWRQKNKIKINKFLQFFGVSKPFNVICIDFFAKKQKLRNLVFERRTLFFWNK